MRKIKLDPEMLHVDTFVTDRGWTDAGTVQGLAASTPRTACGTCAPELTCDIVHCEMSSLPSCPPTNCTEISFCPPDTSACTPGTDECVLDSSNCTQLTSPC
jgi:hypothetical protein